MSCLARMLIDRMAAANVSVGNRALNDRRSQGKAAEITFSLWEAGRLNRVPWL